MITDISAEVGPLSQQTMNPDLVAVSLTGNGPWHGSLYRKSTYSDTQTPHLLPLSVTSFILFVIFVVCCWSGEKKKKRQSRRFSWVLKMNKKGA